MSQVGTLIITRGLPASGKTTWVREQIAADLANRVRISRDDLRRTVFDSLQPQLGDF